MIHNLVEVGSYFVCISGEIKDTLTLFGFEP